MARLLEVFMCAGFLISWTTARYGSEIQPYLVGSSPADIRDYPFILSLRKYTRHICGASIISRNWAITAASCLIFEQPSWLNVKAGSGDFDFGGTIHQIAGIVRHPLFRETNFTTYDYDVALLNVIIPFEFNVTIGAVTLINMNTNVSGKNGTIIGWGYASNTGPGFYRQLRQLDVPIHSESICKSFNIGTITSRMLCAGQLDGKKDVCTGSAGFPLVVNRLFTGVLIGGHGGCAIKNHPSIYTRLSTVDIRTWITSVTGI